MPATFGALIFYGAANLNLPTALTGGATAGNYNLVRNALGDISYNNNAGAATVQFWLGLADVKRPYITFPAGIGQGTTLPTSNEFFEVFGTATGGPENPFSGSQGPTGSQFGTPFTPYGISLIDVFAVYSVQTAALTAATIGVTRAVYSENAAFTNTNVLAATAISVATTTGAGTPHVQKVSLAQPLIFEAQDFADLTVELVITAAATSAIRVYGMGMHCGIQYS